MTDDALFYVLVKGKEVVGAFSGLEEAAREWSDTVSLRAVVTLTDDEYERANQVAREAAEDGRVRPHHRLVGAANGEQEGDGDE
jgi:hypothetical protein